MSVVERIKTAAAEARKNGAHPSKVFLTLDDGRKLYVELVTENHHLGHRIEKEGIHNAIHKIAGLEVVWRSPEFRVS